MNCDDHDVYFDLIYMFQRMIAVIARSHILIAVSWESLAIFQFFDRGKLFVPLQATCRDRQGAAVTTKRPVLSNILTYIYIDIYIYIYTHLCMSLYKYTIHTYI